MTKHASFNAVQSLYLSTQDKLPHDGDRRPDVFACTGESANTFSQADLELFDMHITWMLGERDAIAKGQDPAFKGGHAAFAKVDCPMCRVMLDAAMEGANWRKLNPVAYPEVKENHDGPGREP